MVSAAEGRADFGIAVVGERSGEVHGYLAREGNGFLASLPLDVGNLDVVIGCHLLDDDVDGQWISGAFDEF